MSLEPVLPASCFLQMWWCHFLLYKTWNTSYFQDLMSFSSAVDRWSLKPGFVSLSGRICSVHHRLYVTECFLLHLLVLQLQRHLCHINSSRDDNVDVVSFDWSLSVWMFWSSNWTSFLLLVDLHANCDGFAPTFMFVTLIKDVFLWNRKLTLWAPPTRLWLDHLLFKLKNQSAQHICADGWQSKTPCGGRWWWRFLILKKGRRSKGGGARLWFAARRFYYLLTVLMLKCWTHSVEKEGKHRKWCHESGGCWLDRRFPGSCYKTWCENRNTEKRRRSGTTHSSSSERFTSTPKVQRVC